MARNTLLKQNLNRTPITQKKDLKQDFLKVQNECYLCGHSLNTYVEYIPQTRFAVERAQCHNCMTLIRVKNHSIQ